MTTGYVCPECGLDYDTIAPSDAKVAIRSFGRRYRAALAEGLDDDGDEAILRRRPQPDVWSALEYAAHVADILGASATWIDDMRKRDRPTLSSPDDSNFSRAEAGSATPAEILDNLGTAADAVASNLDRTDEWHRTAEFPWGERDVLTTTRNAVHEGSHHLRDVTRVLDQVRGRP